MTATVRLERDRNGGPLGPSFGLCTMTSWSGLSTAGILRREFLCDPVQSDTAAPVAPSPGSRDTDRSLSNKQLRTGS
jgi:hypothetical protein